MTAYDVVNVLPSRAFPWFNEAKRKTLLRLIADRSDRENKRTILEVGSWFGDSARFFAGYAKKVYCVDTWNGPVDTHQYLLPNLYQQFDPFNAALYHLLRGKVVPLTPGPERDDGLEFKLGVAHQDTLKQAGELFRQCLRKLAANRLVVIVLPDPDERVA